MNKGKIITIRHVAERAGVSISTVSKALNGGGRMSAETREKVRETAAKLGFRPNSLAQSLHQNRSRTIGIISTDRFGRFTFPIMEAMEDVLTAEGIGIFMCNATDNPARERQHIAQLLGKRIDGLVVTARRADTRPPIDVEGRAIPVIYVFSHCNAPAALSFLPDDEGGARLAVEHLLRRKCRRIAHVTGPENFEAVRLRHAGYRRALQEAGLAAKPELYLSGSWSEAWGREAATRLLSLAGRPDGIFCGNDQIARGVCDALRERGLSVPGDIAVVGYDNWEVMAEACRPRLTSIDMNLAELGRAAGKALIALMKGETITGAQRLPASLVQRDSTPLEEIP